MRRGKKLAVAALLLVALIALVIVLIPSQRRALVEGFRDGFGRGEPAAASE